MMIFTDGLMSVMPYLWERVKRPLRFVVSIMPVSFMLYSIFYLFRYY